jgi:hypothetical protein
MEAQRVDICLRMTMNVVDLIPQHKCALQPKGLIGSSRKTWPLTSGSTILLGDWAFFTPFWPQALRQEW